MKSKLDSIMTTYLRAQHRQCAAPIAACAPFSLLEPHACPEPRHELAAPRNLGSRLARREWYSRHPRGGPGGRARDRHFVFGRFRSLRGLRDEGAVLTTAAFVGGDGDRLLAGMESVNPSSSLLTAPVLKLCAFPPSTHIIITPPGDVNLSTITNKRASARNLRAERLE